MVWIIIVILLLLILAWLFFAPFEFYVDTRTPEASLRWMTIGTGTLTYENDKWLLKIRVLFFYKQWELEELIFRKRKKKPLKKTRRKKKPNKWFGKFVKMIRTFRVTKWQIAIDTGDYIRNAWLYSLNFLPLTRNHVFINFADETYLLVVVRNAPWKLAYAFIR